MMESRGLYRLLQSHFVIDDMDQSFTHLIGDGGSPWRSYREEGLVVFCDEGRSHGTKHSFSRSDGIGFTADGTVHIGDARFDAEIIHFIVQQETRTANHCFAAVRIVQSGCDGNQGAQRVYHAEMGGLFAFFGFSCSYGFAFSCLSGPIVTHTLLGVYITRQEGSGYVPKIRIPQVFGPVCIGPSLYFHHQTYRFRCIGSHRSHRIGIQHLQHLRNQDTTTGRGREADDVVPSVIEGYGFSKVWGVLFQVIQTYKTLAVFHFFHNQGCCFSFVESGLSLLLNPIQGASEFWLNQGVARFPMCATGKGRGHRAVLK